MVSRTPRQSATRDATQQETLAALRRYIATGEGRDGLPAALDPPTFAMFLGCSRQLVYKMVADKRIKARRLGSKVLIPVADALKFLQADDAT